MSLTIEVPHAKSPSLGVLILTLNLALFLPQTINRTPPYVLAGTGGGSMLGDVNISAILDSFSVGYDKRVRPNYGGTYYCFDGVATKRLFSFNGLLRPPDHRVESSSPSLSLSLLSTEAFTVTHLVGLLGQSEKVPQSVHLTLRTPMFCCAQDRIVFFVQEILKNRTRSCVEENYHKCWNVVCVILMFRSVDRRLWSQLFGRTKQIYPNVLYLLLAIDYAKE